MTESVSECVCVFVCMCVRVYEFVCDFVCDCVIVLCVFEGVSV